MFFRSKKRKEQVAELYKGVVIEISKNIISYKPDSIKFEGLNNYQNLLLRLFVHIEAMMLSGGKEYVNGVMHCVGDHLVKNNCIGSVEEFVNEMGTSFNQLHKYFEADMRAGEGVPMIFRHEFIKTFANGDDVLDINTLLIFKEMTSIMVQFKGLCHGYKETFTNVEKMM